MQMDIDDWGPWEQHFPTLVTPSNASVTTPRPVQSPCKPAASFQKRRTPALPSFDPYEEERSARLWRRPNKVVLVIEVPNMKADSALRGRTIPKSRKTPGAQPRTSSALSHISPISPQRIPLSPHPAIPYSHVLAGNFIPQRPLLSDKLQRLRSALARNFRHRKSPSVS